MKLPILLHICCAPDATHPVEILSKEFQVLGYFYNPNIQPLDEYSRRLEETAQLMEKLGVTLYRGDYEPELWHRKTEGMETEPEGRKRCVICYRLRLENSAKFAKHMGFHSFTTTLTISPHKNSKTIFNIGKELITKYGVNFLDVDFKKQDGFRKSVIISKRFGLYRQDYCGCIYSLKERLAMKRGKLTELHQEIRDCQRCNFHPKQKVLPSGGVESKVMVIGQAPGKQELVTYKPFSGPAGARLFEWFTRIGIQEEDFRRIAYITATVKCYPGHLLGRIIDKPPAQSQIKNCIPFFEEELKILRPRLLIPVGRLAINKIVGERRLVEVVGKKFRKEIFGHLCTIVPLPHPSGANPWNFRNSVLLDQALELLREEIVRG